MAPLNKRLTLLLQTALKEGGGCIYAEVPNVVFVEYIFSCICSLQSPPRDLLKS